MFHVNRKCWILFVCLLFCVFSYGCGGGKANAERRIVVKRGDISQEAQAMGKIEVKDEVEIKSNFSGVIKAVYVEVGDKIEKNDVLLSINPSPTPFESAEARKNVKVAKADYENLKEDVERKRYLIQKGLISKKEFEDVLKEYEKAKSIYELAQERFAMLEKGEVKIGEEWYKTVINSPIEGTILERFVNVGDPVVPLTSYQPGTKLLTIANLNNVIFKGVVNEIDVGKLKEGMEAKITVGALPEVDLRGEIVNIAPKAKENESTTVFDVEIKLLDIKQEILRIGYSATARIIVEKRENVLLIPEEAVHFERDEVYVSLPGKGKKLIKTGFSNGIDMEVISGLEEGDTILAK